MHAHICGQQSQASRIPDVHREARHLDAKCRDEKSPLARVASGDERDRAEQSLNTMKHAIPRHLGPSSSLCALASLPYSTTYVDTNAAELYNLSIKHVAERGTSTPPATPRCFERVPDTGHRDSPRRVEGSGQY